jgi:hypothetical protein
MIAALALFHIDHFQALGLDGCRLVVVPAVDLVVASDPVDVRLIHRAHRYETVAVCYLGRFVTDRVQDLPNLEQVDLVLHRVC